MSHLIEPHGGKLIDLMVTPERREELRERSREIPVLGPDPAPALRPRAPDERRLLAAHRVHEPAGRRVGVRAACASPTARSGRCRSRSTSPSRWPRSSKPGSLLALRDPEGVMLAVLHVEDRGARPQDGGRGGLRHARRDAPRGRPPPPAHQQHRARRPARGPRAALALRLPRAAPHPRRAAPRVRDPGLAQDRRLPDPQPDAPRPLRAHPAGGEGGRGQPAHPPRRWA